MCMSGRCLGLPIDNCDQAVSDNCHFFHTHILTQSYLRKCALVPIEILRQQCSHAGHYSQVWRRSIIMVPAMTKKFLPVMTIWQQWRRWRWSWWCAYRRRWESVIQNLCFPSPIHQPHKVPSASMARECGAPFTSKLQMRYKLLITNTKQKAISCFPLKHSVSWKFWNKEG